MNENDVSRRAPGTGSPPAQQSERSQTQCGADLPQFRKAEITQQSPALLAPGQAPKLQSEHHGNLTPKLKRGHRRWRKIVNQLVGKPKGCSQDNSVTEEHAGPIRTDGSHDDPGVAEQIRALGVILIEFQLSRNALLDVKLLQVVRVSQQLLLVAETQRSQIGDPWFVPQNVPLFRGVMPDVAENFRSRADQAHLPPQHIPKLRQFVQFGLPQNPSDPGDAGIPVLRDKWPGPFRRRHHCAEFANSEWPPLKTDPDLPVKNVSSIGNFYERSDEQEHRRAFVGCSIEFERKRGKN